MKHKSTDVSDITPVRKPIAVSAGDRWTHADGSIAVVVAVTEKGVVYRNDGVAYESGIGHQQPVAEFIEGRTRA